MQGRMTLGVGSNYWEVERTVHNLCRNVEVNTSYALTLWHILLYIEGLGHCTGEVALTSEYYGVATFILNGSGSFFLRHIDIIVSGSKISVFKFDCIYSRDVDCTSRPLLVVYSDRYIFIISITSCLRDITGQDGPVISYTSHMEFFIIVRVTTYSMSIALTWNGCSIATSICCSVSRNYSIAYAAIAIPTCDICFRISIVNEVVAWICHRCDLKIFSSLSPRRSYESESES